VPTYGRISKSSTVNPNPHCLGIQKSIFVKKKSTGWLKQKIKNASQNILTNIFVSEVFI
jgi:hypothetical protein